MTHMHTSLKENDSLVGELEDDLSELMQVANVIIHEFEESSICGGTSGEDKDALVECQNEYMWLSHLLEKTVKVSENEIEELKQPDGGVHEILASLQSVSNLINSIGKGSNEHIVQNQDQPYSPTNYV